jgi:hypothetical protein
VRYGVPEKVALATAGGFGVEGNLIPPPGRRMLCRGNPRNAVGMKEARPGVEGSKPSRG